MKTQIVKLGNLKEDVEVKEHPWSMEKMALIWFHSSDKLKSFHLRSEAVYIINDLTKITEKMFNDFVETKDFRTMRQHIMYKITTESELVWWAWYKFFEAQGYKKTSWKFLKRASELIQSKWNKK